MPRWHCHSINLRFHQMKYSLGMYRRLENVRESGYKLCQTGHFRVAQASFSKRGYVATDITMIFFILMQIKLIFARKVLHTNHIAHSLVLQVRIYGTIYCTRLHHGTNRVI